MATKLNAGRGYGQLELNQVAFPRDGRIEAQLPLDPEVFGKKGWAKTGGTFCGCFYVKGGHKRTDWFIQHLYEPKGFFTPPYETKDSLYNRLSNLYKEVNVEMVEGIGCFCCKK